MKAALLLFSFGLGACTSHAVSQTTEAITCSADQTPVYTNRFASQAGGSGVATPSDAEAGITNSAPTAAPATSDDSVTAMTVTCGPSICSPGQVAVALSSVPTDTTGAPSGGPSSASPSEGIATTTTTPSSSTPAGSGPTTVCVEPPPDCGNGESPQYMITGSWQCTDCALVVTYGSLYGNSRRCVGAPTIKCQHGDVPTWSYDDDKWECQPTCDNGDYDQHTIGGQLVCVPC